MNMTSDDRDALRHLVAALRVRRVSEVEVSRAVSEVTSQSHNSGRTVSDIIGTGNAYASTVPRGSTYPRGHLAMSIGIGAAALATFAHLIMYFSGLLRPPLPAVLVYYACVVAVVLASIAIGTALMRKLPRGVNG